MCICVWGVGGAVGGHSICSVVVPETQVFGSVLLFITLDWLGFSCFFALLCVIKPRHMIMLLNVKEAY